MIPQDTSVSTMRLNIWGDNHKNSAAPPAVMEETKKPRQRMANVIDGMDPVIRQKLIWLATDITKWIIFFIILIALNLLANPGKTPAEILFAAVDGCATSIGNLFGGL